MNSLKVPLIIICLLLLGFGLFEYRRNAPTTSQPLSHHEIMQQDEAIKELIQTQDPDAVFAYLRNNIQDNTSLARECHPLLHSAGHAAYKKYGSFTEAIKYQDELCNSGFTHGLIEAHFGAAENINEALRTTCDKSDFSRYQQWQCTHGIGHGVMYFTNKDLPKSIALCRQLHSQFETTSCINGVFMERFIAIDHAGMQRRHDNFDVSICDTQENSVKADCYLYAPTAHLALHPNDYKGAINLCQTAESKFVSACLRGVGMQALKDNITNPALANKMCMQLPQTQQVYCVSGAVSLHVFHSGSINQTQSLCSTTFKKYEQRCHHELQSLKQYLEL